MPDSHAILLLHGDDEYAISGHVKKLCANLGDSSTAEMNITRFDGRAGLDFEAFNTAINAAPFLAPHRVVVLEHPTSAFSSPRTQKKVTDLPDKTQQANPDSPPGEDELSEDRGSLSRKKFIDLLEKAQPTTTIVLAEFDVLKRDHWLLKWAAGAGTRAGVHIYSMPTQMEMPRWIESQAKMLKGAIEPGAAARLSERVGADTRIAMQELTKLLTYVNFERPVTLRDVDLVTIDSAPGYIFKLVDALGQGDGKKAQHVLHQLLDEEEAFAVWGMVIRQFRLLLQARELLDERRSVSEIQKTLGVHEYVAQKVTSQAKRFSIAALESIYHKLLEIDEGAKTSQVPLDLALDMLVVELVKK